ncbi:hypothetical protein EVAR_96710_1 [Eumeta japonica]|uniref:Uncharacterized protein n=1 Tax=Eumeta variegata TaxID=151549 RepID=A0A4C1WHD0_EUMVA|nr:hypothetical protein EVAR_96710_1 [Eumeta japonica]
MVISSSMTYGLNVVALTKSKRTRLRQYEREILKDILQVASVHSRPKTQEILEGKTITKIVKNKKEMKTAADELYELPETDTVSSTPSEENEE